MIRFPLIYLLLLFMGCTLKNDNKENQNRKANGLIKSFRNGKLYSAVNYKYGIKEGKAYSYYSNGKVNLEMSYSHGSREGQSKRYYESGLLYQTTEYENNLKHGIQTKYRANGDLISELRYEYDEPCIGLKEHVLQGDLKKYYPTITITPIDEVSKNGTYSIQVVMSNKTNKVTFYEGYLTDSGCLHSGLHEIPLDAEKRIGTIKYQIEPNQMLDFQVNIIAVVKTIHGNSYITQNRIDILKK